MTMQTHPDPLLERYRVAVDREQKLDHAEKMLTSRRNDSLGKLLDSDFEGQGSIKPQALAKLNQRRQELDVEVRAIASEMTRALLEKKLGEAGEQSFGPWVGRHVGSLQDLAPLAELHESLNKAGGVWTGDRPWEPSKKMTNYGGAK